MNVCCFSVHTVNARMLTSALSDQVDMHFMKKIPEGAEASNVLVGELDFLERPIVAFVRLSPAVLLTGLTEVPIPTRYTALLQIHKQCFGYKSKLCEFKNPDVIYILLTISRQLSGSSSFSWAQMERLSNTMKLDAQWQP